jgi:hypothetical protein
MVESPVSHLMGRDRIRPDISSTNLPELLEYFMSLTRLRISSKLSYLPLLAGFLVILGTAGVNQAQAQPRVDLSETAHDFGQVREDMTLVHNFTIKNFGDQDLKVLDVDPDCACTVAHYDRVIPPGGTGKITLQIQPFSVVHAFTKKTYVRFNAPDFSSVTLRLTGNAQKSIEIEPSHIVRFRGAPGTNLTAEVRLTSNLPFPWEITRVENFSPDKFDVHLKTDRPGKVYTLEVRNKTLDEGHYVGMVQLFTNVVHKPKIVIRVIADLYPETVRP